jgi:hypothetical protein
MYISAMLFVASRVSQADSEFVNLAECAGWLKACILEELVRPEIAAVCKFTFAYNTEYDVCSFLYLSIRSSVTNTSPVCDALCSEDRVLFALFVILPYPHRALYQKKFLSDQLPDWITMCVLIKVAPKSLFLHPK